MSRTASPADRRLGLALVGLAALAWGTIPLLVRHIGAMPTDLGPLGVLDLSPVVIVFWRVAFGAVAVYVSMVLRRRTGALRVVHGRTGRLLALNGVLLAVHWVLFFGALVFTRIAVAELLTYTGPVYVAALVPFVLGEPFDRRVLLPVGLALAGVAVILWPELAGLGAGTSAAGSAAGSVGGVGEGNGLLGPLMAIGAAVGYALLMLNTKRLLDEEVSTSVLMFVEAAVATLFLAPAVLLLPSPSGPEEWAALAGLGIVHSTLVVFVFMAGLRRVRPDHAAVLTYAEPLSAVLFAALLLGEPLTMWVGVGGAAVLAAGALVAQLEPVGGPEGPLEPLDEARLP